MENSKRRPEYIFRESLENLRNYYQMDLKKQTERIQRAISDDNILWSHETEWTFAHIIQVETISLELNHLINSADIISASKQKLQELADHLIKRREVFNSTEPMVNAVSHNKNQAYSNLHRLLTESFEVLEEKLKEGSND